MLDTLVTSKTRLKLLTKFFLNPQTKAFLRGLEESFGESSNSVRLELNRFEAAGLLCSAMEGYRKVYYANTQHPMFAAIHNIIRQHLGIDPFVAAVTQKLTGVEQIWISGEMAKGNNTDIIKLIIVSNDLNNTDPKTVEEEFSSFKNPSFHLTLLSPSTFLQIQRLINANEIFLLWQLQPAPQH